MTGSPSKLIGLVALLALIAAACSSGTVEQDTAAAEAEQVEPEVETVDANTTSPTTTTSTTTSTTTTTTRRPDLSGTTIQVAVVDNPTMDLIREITDEFFTGPTGIAVEYITTEATNRELVSLPAQIFTQRDLEVIMIGPFESPRFGANEWLEDLSLFAEDDAYDLDDFIPSVTAANSTDDGLFAVPFYAESSMIMFNQQIMDDAGIDFPENPTWQEIADIARQVDSEETPGICLRGRPGWGDFGAPLTTVVNTFGGCLLYTSPSPRD